jgi:TonB family protein
MKMLLPGFAILLFAFGASGQNANVAAQDPADRPLKVLKKPHAAPGYCTQGEAVTVVSVVFDKSATVTDAVLVKRSGCAEFDDRAIAAALKIKFEPAIKNGQPVTVSKRIEYAYRRY